jgi:tRNA(Arg) A34 adenosine deaminase TadA
MDNPFMARAIQLSIENVHSGRGGPFGAVIVKDGNMIAEAANQVTSTKDPTAHAEILAIREACAKLGAFDLQGCEIYTSCEPCPMCLGAIYWARISRIYFAGAAADASRIGFDDSLIYRELAQPHAQRARKRSPRFAPGKRSRTRPSTEKPIGAITVLSSRA